MSSKTFFLKKKENYSIYYIAWFFDNPYSKRIYHIDVSGWSPIIRKLHFRARTQNELCKLGGYLSAAPKNDLHLDLFVLWIESILSPIIQISIIVYGEYVRPYYMRVRLSIRLEFDPIIMTAKVGGRRWKVNQPYNVRAVNSRRVCNNNVLNRVYVSCSVRIPRTHKRTTAMYTERTHNIIKQCCAFMPATGSGTSPCGVYAIRRQARLPRTHIGCTYKVMLGTRSTR